MGYSGPIETLGAVRHGERDAEEIALSRLRWRTRLLGGFVILLVVAAASYGVRWFTQTIQFVSTDDAYVDAQLADIAPQTDGTIAAVAVSDTQAVKRGDLLLQLDPADAQLAVDQARANYEQAVRRVQQYAANVGGALANVAGRQSDVARTTIDYDRRAGLVKSGAVSGDEVSTARNALENAKSALAVAQQALAAQQAMVADADARQNPEVRAAKAALDRAELDLKRTEIRSPVDGIVAQSHAQIGQRVHTGAPLMSVVPVREAWVNANFKEVQLARIKPGQAVSLTSDLYGSGVVFHGRVAGVGGGTGAAFSVIPAQNATGNWIKVVQRLPVRIALDPRELAQRPLRVGLSMAVTVNLDPFAARAPVPRPAAKAKVAKPKPVPQIAATPAVIHAEGLAKPAPVKAASVAVASRPVLANVALPPGRKYAAMKLLLPVLSVPAPVKAAAWPVPVKTAEAASAHTKPNLSPAASAALAAVEAPVKASAAPAPVKAAEAAPSNVKRNLSPAAAAALAAVEAQEAAQSKPADSKAPGLRTATSY